MFHRPIQYQIYNTIYKITVLDAMANAIVQSAHSSLAKQRGPATRDLHTNPASRHRQNRITTSPNRKSRITILRRATYEFARQPPKYRPCQWRSPLQRRMPQLRLVQSQPLGGPANLPLMPIPFLLLCQSITLWLVCGSSYRTAVAEGKGKGRAITNWAWRTVLSVLQSAMSLQHK